MNKLWSSITCQKQSRQKIQYFSKYWKILILQLPNGINSECVFLVSENVNWHESSPKLLYQKGSKGNLLEELRVLRRIFLNFSLSMTCSQTSTHLFGTQLSMPVVVLPHRTVGAYCEKLTNVAAARALENGDQSKGGQSRGTVLSHCKLSLNAKNLMPVVTSGVH